MLLFAGFLPCSSIAQETYSLLFRCPYDEMAMSVIENHQHEYVAVGFDNTKPYYDLSGRRSKIWKFSNSIDTVTFVYSFHDTSAIFTRVFQLENNHYHVFGTYFLPPNYNQLAILMLELDSEMKIVKQKTLSYPSLTDYGASVVRKYMNKYYLWGEGNLNSQIVHFVCSLDNNYDISNFRYYQSLITQDSYFMDCILSPDSTRFYAVTNFPSEGDGACHLFVYDTTLNLLSVKVFPHYMNLNQGIFEDFSHNVTIANFPNNRMLTGAVMGKMLNWDQEVKIGFSLLDTTMKWVPPQYFGSDDTTFYTAYGQPTFVFRNPDSIFFTGTKRQIPSFFPQKPNWLIAGALDSTLQPYFINYYGGDAYYHANSMLLTSDGGYLILADRYDKNTQDNEYDVFFLKLDKNGLVTGNTLPEICPLRSFLLSPNPGSNEVHLDLAPLHAQLFIYNVSGILVHSQSLTQGTNLINTTKLPKGIYMFSVTDENNNTNSQKWIKQ